MKKPVTRRINVGVAALARETGLAEATISKKMKNGQMPEQIRAAAARRQATLAAGGKVRGPKKKSPPLEKPKAYTPGRGRPPVPTEYAMVVASRSRYEQLEHWKVRRAKALAERQELENMLRRCELLPVSYLRQWGTKFLTAAKDELLKGPSELADNLAAEDDALKTQAILQAWVELVLGKFAHFDYLGDDPDRT